MIIQALIAASLFLISLPAIADTCSMWDPSKEPEEYQKCVGVIMQELQDALNDAEQRVNELEALYEKASKEIEMKK